MAFYGKTFKLFSLPGMPISGSATEAQIKASIDNRVYIKDISIYFPVASVEPTSIIDWGATYNYANADGIINAATAALLDQISPIWQQQSMISYSSIFNDSDVYNNIMSQFPNKLEFDANNGISYLIWDESDTNDYGIILSRALNGQKISGVRISTGELSTTPFQQTTISNSFYTTYDRVDLKFSFYYDNKLYTFSPGNSYSSTSYFRASWTTYARTITGAGSTFFVGASDNYQPIFPQPDDPFAEGGTSEPGGGGGAQDNTSDTITDSPLPTLSVADTGFTTIYNPSLAQLRSLASYMWTDDTFLETLINHAKQLLENPINSIIALNILPCQVADAGSQEVKVLYIPTGVYMNKAANQFTDVDCGSVVLDNYYNSAMDYSPFTRVSCYLPYIGQVTLNTDEVMGKTLSITYRVDIVTGMCVAKIFVDGSVLYQFSGHCAVNMPVTSADFSSYVGAVIQAAKMTAGVVAAAAGAPAAAAGLIGGPAPQSSTSKTVTTARNPNTGRQITTGTETVTRESTPASFGETVGKAATNTVDAVMGSKMIVDHSGGFSGNSGYLGIRRPYLIIERPRMCNPAEYGKYNGYPSMLFLNLGTCSGYTEVQSIQLTGIRATNPELSELSMILKSGVIL